MSLPVPVPGLVIRYGFLWSHEAEAGASEASKERPCTIVVAAKNRPNGAIRVIVAPITHTPPDDRSTSVELAANVCSKLGLDGSRHWLRFDELNSFEWPGFDLRVIPGTNSKYDYGLLPEKLFYKIRNAIVERAKAGKVKANTNRD